MGMFKLFSSSSYDDPCIQTEESFPNPNPSNYKILIEKKIGTFLIIKVNYPDCVNYEGNKILVYQDCTLTDLINQSFIDPHFSNTKKFKSPIARFEPTDKGLYYASTFCYALSNIKRV